jgi:hypothetical protein
MMQSTEEHQEIPKGEAAVMPVAEARKRRRVRNLAAEHRQKRKEKTRGNRGSRRNSAAACRKLTRRAQVAWHKRNLVRRSGTQENCGPLKEFSAKGVLPYQNKDTHRAKVAWHKERSHEETSDEQGRWKVQTRNKFTNGNRKGWTFGKRHRVDPEGSTGMKDPNTRRHRRLKNENTAGRIFEKTFRLQIAKREDGSSVGSLKIRNWTLWRGRPLLKEKGTSRNTLQAQPSKR